MVRYRRRPFTWTWLKTTDEGEEDEEEEDGAVDTPHGKVHRVNQGQVVGLSGATDEYIHVGKEEQRLTLRLCLDNKSWNTIAVGGECIGR